MIVLTKRYRLLRTAKDLFESRVGSGLKSGPGQRTGDKVTSSVYSPDLL